MRPLLAGGDRAEKFRTLMSQRVPLYRRAATIRVNTNRRNPGAVVRYIVSRLENPRAEDAPPKPRRAPSDVAPLTGVADAEPVRGHHPRQPGGIGPPCRGPA